MHVAEVTGDKIDPKAKLELIQQEEAAIQREKEEEAAAVREEAEKKSKEAKTVRMDTIERLRCKRLLTTVTLRRDICAGNVRVMRPKGFPGRSLHQLAVVFDQKT